MCDVYSSRFLVLLRKLEKFSHLLTVCFWSFPFVYESRQRLRTHLPIQYVSMNVGTLAMQHKVQANVHV